MLNLQNAITLDKETIESPNLVDKFTASDLSVLGDLIKRGYVADEASRSKWFKRMEAAMDLAMQIQKDKNWPWPGCSNVAFPLVTIAVMQFHSRAYPAIITGPEVVKYRVLGEDPTGNETKRAARVGLHMSWQLMEEDSGWESQQDKLLINVPVVGCTFKKSYHAGIQGKNKSELVMAKDLVLDYYAKSVEDCVRKTHIIPLYRNEIYERVQVGTFKDILKEPWYQQTPANNPTQQTQNSDNRKGQIPPQPDEMTPFTFLEQHTWLDLDKDGYAEPYIVTIESNSMTVVRVVCRFEQEADIQRTMEGKVLSIRATEYFTKYSFLPSPDGGIYDLGFGILLGPLNESTNSLLNQLIDAGTMANTAGGFLGRGAKIRGGVYTFAPFGWQRVDSTGEDLHKSIFPLPVREPSNVLFQLLSLLINYTNRISGSTDIMVGESVGQNTPADTARQMQQEGMKIYNAIFKRVWTSMKEEFRKLYILNARYMPATMTFGLEGENVGRADYLGDPTRIAPTADPNTTSQADKLQQAMLLKQNAMQTPGYNGPEIEKMLLRAMNVANVDQIYNPEKFPPGEDLKIQLKKMDLQKAQMELESDMQQFIMGLMEERRLNDAKIMEIQASIMELAGSAQTAQSQQQTEQFKAMIEISKSRNDVLMQMIQHNTERLKMHTAKVQAQTKEVDLERKENQLANDKRKQVTGGK